MSPCPLLLSSKWNSCIESSFQWPANLFLLGISLLWWQLYMCMTWSSFLCLLLGGFILISFLFGAFVVFVHISQFVVWFMPSVFFCCCWNYVPVLSASSAFCRLVHDHPFSLCFGWYSISKSAWYVISCVILGILAISSVCCALFFAIFNHCSGLVPSSIFLFDGLFLSAYLEHF